MFVISRHCEEHSDVAIPQLFRRLPHQSADWFAMTVKMEENMDNRIKDLMAYLDSAHSVFHAVEGLRNILENAGYTRLQESGKWELAKGGKYYNLHFLLLYLSCYLYYTTNL